jgi:hypothetical protein
MGDVTAFRKAATARVLDGPGQASPEARRAAFANEGVAGAARALIDKVAKHADQITDDDVAAAKRELSEDQIFELVVCAAMGQATRQLEAALAALAAAAAPEDEA